MTLYPSIKLRSRKLRFRTYSTEIVLSVSSTNTNKVGEKKHDSCNIWVVFEEQPFNNRKITHIYVL